jgi:hypothetical protein
MKALKLFQRQEKGEGFDPMMQGNLPFVVFHLASELIHATIIHLPAPIYQEFIDKAVVNSEFRGFLHSLRNQKFLYINLQDRNSWKDYARVSAMEKLSQEEEFADVLKVVSLAEHTDFYNQINDYANLFQAFDFCNVCIEQIMGGGQCGFSLLKEVVSSAMVKELVIFVHEQFFDKKEFFVHQEKIWFIEILYFFLVLKIIDQQKPDIISFSCKDGVDAGASMSGAFYGFARMLSSSKPWEKEDEDFFLFAFFAPALLARNRSISFSCFQRSVSALQYFNIRMQKNRDKILSATSSLFSEDSLAKIKVS